MSGLEYAGFGLLFGLLFGYIANDAVSFKRRLTASPVSGVKKGIAFILFNLLHLLGFIIGAILSAAFIIWYDTVPLSEVMDYIARSKEMKLFIGFYLAIAFIIVYFRQPGRKPANG